MTSESPCLFNPRAAQSEPEEADEQEQEVAASPRNNDEADPPQIQHKADKLVRPGALGNRIQLVPGRPASIPKKPELSFEKEDEISEVGAINEFLDREEIDSLVESLKTLGNQSTQSQKKKAPKVASLTVGKELFGFGAHQPKPRMSKALGEIEVGSEFKEAGVLEEALESETRNAVVDSLQEMISQSRRATEKSSRKSDTPADERQADLKSLVSRESTQKNQEQGSQTASDFILSGLNVEDEFIEIQNEGDLMIIPEKEEDNSKHVSLRNFKKPEVSPYQTQSSKNISTVKKEGFEIKIEDKGRAGAEADKDTGRAEEGDQERAGDTRKVHGEGETGPGEMRKGPPVQPEAKEKQGNTVKKSKKNKRLNQKILELEMEYEKISQYIPSNTKRRVQEKHQREKLRLEAEELAKKKKLYRRKPRTVMPQQRKEKPISKSLHKKKKKPRRKNPNKSETPKKKIDVDKLAKANLRKGKYIGAETGSNYYTLMLEAHHNTLYSGPRKAYKSKIIQELKRFSKTNRMYGINDEMLTVEGKAKMGLDMQYKTPVIPVKKPIRRRVPLNMKSKTHELSSQTSLKRNAKRYALGNHMRSKSSTNLKKETPKAASALPPKIQNEFESKFKGEDKKSVWERYRSKAKSLTARQREDYQPRNINLKSSQLDQDVARLIIQKRKIIKMKVDLLRLENLIEREIKLRKIRNLEDKETDDDKGKVLMKKFRETAKRQIEETNIFLDAIGKYDWISQDKVLGDVRESIRHKVPGRNPRNRFHPK